MQEDLRFAILQPLILLCSRFNFILARNVQPRAVGASSANGMIFTTQIFKCKGREKGAVMPAATKNLEHDIL